MSLDPKSLGNGKEQHKVSSYLYQKGKKFYQYDYRHKDGELFSCIASSLKAARTKRDQWLEERMK